MPDSGITQAFPLPRLAAKKPAYYHEEKHFLKLVLAQELFERIGGLAEGFLPAILYGAIGQLS
jgi:hypothetical protein